MRAIGVLIAAIALAVLVTSSAAGRLHRLHLPPSNLPHSLSVDEWEWHVQPSQNVVAPGWVAFHGYDRGMDDHDMQLIGPTGILDTVYMTPGSQRVVHRQTAARPLPADLFAVRGNARVPLREGHARLDHGALTEPFHDPVPTPSAGCPCRQAGHPADNRSLSAGRAPASAPADRRRSPGAPPPARRRRGRRSTGGRSAPL